MHTAEKILQEIWMANHTLGFTNPFTGERSPHLAAGYGLGNALVQNQTIYVFATKTPLRTSLIIQRSAFSGRMILCRLHGSHSGF